MPRGYKNHRPWTDADNDTLRALIAQGMTDRLVGEAMGFPRTTIEYRRSALKIKTPYRPDRSLPDDFKELAPTLTMRAARIHWRAAPDTIKQWHAEAGTQPGKRVYKTKKSKQAKAPIKFFRPPGMPVVLAVPHRGTSPAAHAQMFLQRLGPCFKACVVDPKASDDLWVVHGRRVNESEMLSIAARKGFRLAA